MRAIAYLYANVATGDWCVATHPQELENLIKSGIATHVRPMCDAVHYIETRDFVRRILNHDDLGFSCLPYVRDEARKVLGIEPCETIKPAPLAASFREIPSELDYHQAACFSDPEAQQSGFNVPKAKQGFGVTSWYSRLVSAARIMFNKLLQHFN